MRRPRGWILAPLLLVLFAGKLDKMSTEERSHWRALRVFVEERDQRQWLRLKTEEERNAWLVERGLWDRFYQHDAATRDQIVAGDVRVGWGREMLSMAWGSPFEKLRLTGRNAARSERLIYRFEVDRDGFASPLVGSKIDHRAVDRYQVNVTIDDEIITGILELDDWE